MSRAPRSQAARRDWGSDDSHTPIVHIDMDAFFVSVELLDKPQLRGVPLAVGGQERGVISAASYEARAFGVNSAMPVAQAKRLCPQLVILPPRMAAYREVSHTIMEILRSVTPAVEQLSVDEAFLDVGGARKLFGTPVQIGTYLRAEIRAHAGVPASVGIANTKHLAKIASAHAKPDGLLLVPASASLDFLRPLPVGAMWGVGEKTRALLERKGVQTIGDVVALGETALVRLLGAASGMRLYALAINRDSRRVEPVHTEKSMSKEQTFFEPLMCVADVEKVMLEQAYAIGRRLRSECVTAATISIKIRSASFETITRALTLPVPTDSNHAIYDASRRLLSSVNFPSDGVRLIGVKAGSLVDSSKGEQLALDDDGRSRKMDVALDAVMAKYGRGAVAPGTLLRSGAPNDRESSATAAGVSTTAS